MSRQGRRRGQEESCTPWLAGFSMSASLVIESVVGRCYLYRSIRAISHGGEEDDVCRCVRVGMHVVMWMCVERKSRKSRTGHGHGLVVRWSGEGEVGGWPAGGWTELERLGLQRRELKGTTGLKSTSGRPGEDTKQQVV